MVPFSIRISILLFCIFILAGCTGQPPGGALLNGHLRPCPSSPNCVNSEKGDEDIAPLHPTIPLEQSWTLLPTLIESMGGEVKMIKTDYFWATFRSKRMGFIDDLELRLDRVNGVIQIRSGSRTGYSDFGVNLARVETLRQNFSQMGKRTSYKQ